MAARRQWSIGMLMVLVSMAAVDCAVVRGFLSMNTESDWLGVGIVLGTPMTNVLILGLLRMRAKAEKRRFWLAFEVAGWFLTTCFFAFCWYRPDLAAEPIDVVWVLLQHLGWSPSGFVEVTICLFLAIVLVYGFLPALAAAIVGWIHDGYRIVIVRRVRQVEQASDDGASLLATEGG